MKQEVTAEPWAIVEVMGHSQYAGRLSEYSALGVPLVRVEVPAVNDQPAFEKLLGAASIFCVTPVTEEVARAVAEQFRVRPLSLVSLPAAEPARLPHAKREMWENDDDEEVNY